MAIVASRVLSSSITRFKKLASDFLFKKITVSTITTAAAVTFTVDQIFGGLIFREVGGAARADLTPSASQIINYMKNSMIGDSFEFSIVNNSVTANATTLTAGVGVTIAGTASVAQNAIKRFLVVANTANTSSGNQAATPLVTIYSVANSVY